MTSLEREQLRAARAGDERAFWQLVAPYRAELHAHCYRTLRSSHDADDALQEALLRAWRAFPRFDRPGSLRAWLYRIAGNCAIDVLSRRGVPTVTLVPDGDTAEATDATPHADAERREEVELALLAAHERLPARQCAVLILREGLDFSAAEVADTLETTTASVNSALQRARATVVRPAGAPSDRRRSRRLVRRYADAWARDDVDGLVEMLVADAA